MVPKVKRLHNKSIGKDGEDLAAQFLKDRGYEIVDRNWRSRFGEIDIVATKNNILYLVEVKTRSSNQYGFPHEAINAKKLQRMQLTAQLYAKSTGYKGEMKLILVEILGAQCSILELE
jgi:putative endonuclease